MKSNGKLEKWVAVYSHAITDWIHHELRDLPGINDSNYFYLLIAVEFPGASQKEMVASIDREQSIVTKAIKNLIQNGWLRMERNPDDRRKTAIYATEKTIDVYPRVKAVIERANDYAASGLTDEERETLGRLIRKATAAMNAKKKETLD